MHVLAGLAGLALAGTMLTELFVVMLVPRRVKRDPRIARQLYDVLWPPWRRLGRRLGGRSGETFLGLFGPLGFVGMLAVWALGLMLGLGLMQWAVGSHLGPHADLGDDVYFASADFLTAGAGSLSPTTTAARVLAVAGTACGFGVLTIVIAYLPSLFSAFSRRETAVSRLDPRAGSPPSAGRLVVRSTRHGDWDVLSAYLSEWEGWASELMETHLSYPVLAYYRSQHVNQNWLGALTCVLDASALTAAAAPDGSADAARYTFALGRHAVADLAYTFRAAPLEDGADRLPGGELAALLERLERNDVPLAANREEIAARLARLRAQYEPLVRALSARLALELPSWSALEGAQDNWRTTTFH